VRCSFPTNDPLCVYIEASNGMLYVSVRSGKSGNKLLTLFVRGYYVLG